MTTETGNISLHADVKKNMQKKHLKFIAYAQALGIILVVVGHSFHEYPDGEMGHTLLLYKMMFNFTMPLFVFVSGFLLTYTSLQPSAPYSPCKFITKKAKRLLLPFVILSTLAFVPRSLFSGMADEDLNFSFGSFLHSLFYSDSLVIPYFWFLQMSFFLLCVTFVCVHFARKLRIGDRYTFIFLMCLLEVSYSLDAGALTHNFFSINEVFRLGTYFILGCLFCDCYELIKSRIDLATIGWFLFFAVGWVVLCFLGENNYLYRVASLFGIGMCVSFCMILEKKQIGIFDCFKGATYMIFLLSWFFNVLTQQILVHYVVAPWWVYTILSIVSGVFMPLLIYRLMLRLNEKSLTKAVAFALGQTLK